MGFGLHMGKAVQGAIGSERKLDATYISEAVEFAEFLESSTKQYGLKMLMSDAFYDLLDPVNRRRCRKIDQLLLPNEEEAQYLDDMELLEVSEKMDLYTFDMDIEALWRKDILDKGMSPGRDDASDEGSERSAGGSSLTRNSTPIMITRILKGPSAGMGLSSRNVGGSGSSSKPGMGRRGSLLFRPGGSKFSSDVATSSLLRSSDLKTCTSLIDFEYSEPQ